MEGTRHLLLLLRGTLLEVRVAVTFHPAKILHQLLGNYYPCSQFDASILFQQNDASPCRELNEKNSRSSRQEIALRYFPEPKPVLKDYPTVVDLNLVLNLPTPILPF